MIPGLSIITLSFFFARRSPLNLDKRHCMQVGAQFLQALNHFQRYAYV
jgi:hypothetical protein